MRSAPFLLVLQALGPSCLPTIHVPKHAKTCRLSGQSVVNVHGPGGARGVRPVVPGRGCPKEAPLRGLWAGVNECNDDL